MAPQRDNGKITGPEPYNIFNRGADVESRNSEIYKVANVDNEKEDNPKIIGPKPYKIFNRRTMRSEAAESNKIFNTPVERASMNSGGVNDSRTPRAVKRSMDTGSLAWRSAPREIDYFGSPDKILVPFDHDWVNLTDNGIGGIRYADDKCKDMIPPVGGSVSVPDDFASKYSLAPGSVIRDQHYQPMGLSSLSDITKRNHVLHCVEATRKALHCFIDPTFINLEMEYRHMLNGQVMRLLREPRHI
ncbi:hypothetical protein F4782DRAFT_535855 [Xylaria castorea]|nr:hypothetical protein F4782DRAFT_535855 [Xylaria castorea]